eukprot:jgi/Tetstr1/464102/TSEL_008907.t1
MEIAELVERAVRSAGVLGRLRSPGSERAVARHAALFADRPVPEAAVRRRLEELAGYVDALGRVLADPGIPQRTPEWYAARETMVTGSELASATTPAQQRQFFQRKLAGPEGWNDLKDKPAIKWGVKYEPVACELYERRTGARVHEFGLLPHRTIEGFGASPDGITDMGIMLEIKCPFTRVITGEVPGAYYSQIQAQLDTAGLRECDFLECKLAEYEGAEEFLDDECPDDRDLTRGGLEKGAVWQSGDAHEVAFGRRAAEWAAERPGAALWRLVVYSRVRVHKDDAFVQRLRPDIDRAVARIAEYRSDPSALERDFPPKPDPWNLPSFAFRGA